MALPTTYVLDREGKLAQKNVGMLNARETEAGMRVLAGMKTDAQIVRWDGKEKVVGLENASAVTGIPGIDLASLGPERKTGSDPRAERAGVQLRLPPHGRPLPRRRSELLGQLAASEGNR